MPGNPFYICRFLYHFALLHMSQFLVRIFYLHQSVWKYKANDNVKRRVANTTQNTFSDPFLNSIIVKEKNLYSKYTWERCVCHIFSHSKSKMSSVLTGANLGGFYTIDCFIQHIALCRGPILHMYTLISLIQIYSLYVYIEKLFNRSITYDNS